MIMTMEMVAMKDMTSLVKEGMVKVETVLELIIY
jgi:hypothetical protein